MIFLDIKKIYLYSLTQGGNMKKFYAGVVLEDSELAESKSNRIELEYYKISKTRKINFAKVNKTYGIEIVKKEYLGNKRKKEKNNLCNLTSNEKIANKLTGAMEKIEDTVVGGYNKVEDAVVGRYNKIEDAFVGRYLTHEGESVAEAKQRLQKQHSNTIEDSEQKAKDAGNCACEDVSAAEEEKE